MSKLPDSSIVEAVADVFGFQSVGLVEKDYAVAQLLRAVAAIQVIGFLLVFGGGTSLARVYRLIQRMSEDVDLKLVPLVAVTKSQAKKRRSELKRTVVAALQAAGFGIDYDRDVRADHENTHVEFTVPYECTDAPDILRPAIKLELMASTLRRPAVWLPVSSFVAEALKQPPEVVGVPCISVTETAAEKMISLTRRIAVLHESGGARPFDRTLIRHVHDLHAIVGSVDIPDACQLYRELVANDVAQYGNQHPVFNADPAKACFLALDDLEANWTHRQAYDTFEREMVFGGRAGFDQALDTVRTLVSQAWGVTPRRAFPSAALYGVLVDGTASRLVADFTEGAGFAQAIESAQDLSIDISPEADAALPDIELFLPPVGVRTVASALGQDITPVSAASAICADAMDVVADRHRNAVWSAARGFDPQQSEGVGIEKTTAMMGVSIHRIVVDGAPRWMTTDAVRLKRMAPQVLRHAGSMDEARAMSEQPNPGEDGAVPAP